MSVKDTELLDLLATTLPDLPKQEFEVGWDNQDYEWCRIMQKSRYVINGGDMVERQIMLDNLGNARYRRNYDTDEPSTGNVMHTIRAPWCRLSADYSWDEFEILRNKNDAKGFIDMMKVKRVEGLWGLAELIENRAWKTPTSSTDDLYPYGVPYYIRMMDKDTTTDGFVGKTIRYQNGSTGTVCANIDASTEAKWRNYAALYTNIDNSFLKAFRLAFMYTRFKAPLIVKDPSNKRTAQKRIYTDFDTTAQLMDLADAKDDNHKGKDVLGNLRVDDGGLAFINRLPVVPIPQLENVTDPETGDAASPVYTVDFKYFIPFIHQGYWMKEKAPMTSVGQHTTFTVFLDGAHNNMCTNARLGGFVLHKALTA